MKIFECVDLVSGYQGLPVIRGVSLEVEEGETICLLGRTGAGKSTLLKTIAGYVKPVSGQILFQGIEVTGWPSYRLVRAGMSLCPDTRGILRTISVQENLELALRASADVLGLQLLYEYVPILRERGSQMAGSLSGGEQQMLSLSCALIRKPKVLLIDEFSEGLHTASVEKLLELIAYIRTTYLLTMIVVEPRIELAGRLGDRAYLLDRGEVTLKTTMKALLQNDEVLLSSIV
jgi:branched-chain amino acid transport system ATP-binding protein